MAEDRSIEKEKQASQYLRSNVFRICSWLSLVLVFVSLCCAESPHLVQLRGRRGLVRCCVACADSCPVSSKIGHSQPTGPPIPALCCCLSRARLAGDVLGGLFREPAVSSCRWLAHLEAAFAVRIHRNDCFTTQAKQYLVLSTQYPVPSTTVVAGTAVFLRVVAYLQR